MITFIKKKIIEEYKNKIQGLSTAICGLENLIKDYQEKTKDYTKLQPYSSIVEKMKEYHEEYLKLDREEKNEKAENFKLARNILRWVLNIPATTD